MIVAAASAVAWWAIAVSAISTVLVGFGAVFLGVRLTAHAARDEQLAKDAHDELRAWRAEVNESLGDLRERLAEIAGIVKWVRPDLDSGERRRH